ncbi:MAG: serine/threonine-protein kinase [Lachnospiraceae bacterium]|nr:serine/threonine-protein kinase [Lachnospiraceae bacterium]
MAQLGFTIDNKYEVLKQIGKGGMSTVYLAMDKRLNKQWAVKEIKKVANDKNNEIVVQSLLIEANMMKKLDHPSLPRIVDIIDSGKTIYVVMDYIEGESLDKILASDGAQPQDKVIKWAKQLCDVLRYLHSQNPPIIYRDMKPANVMLKPEGTLKVIDFGIAREFKEHNISDTVSLGTKGYAAPEQFGGMGQTDVRTDIYCLGVTLYHLVTGQNPSEPPYQMYPIRQWNPSLSSGFETIITKCTQLNPDDRYQNCDELMYALEHYDEMDSSYRKKQKKKLRLFIGAVSMSAIMCASGLGFSALSTSENNKDYDQKVNISTSTDYYEKIQSYKEAIALYPYKYEAYIKMLEAYTDNNQFNTKESNEFLGYYNDAFSNKDSENFDISDVGYSEMNYLAGITYLYLFDMENDNTTFRSRALKAYPFFESIMEGNNTSYENYGLSESYYIICKFYKEYMSNSANTKEPTLEIYTELLQSIKTCIENLDGDYSDNDNLPYIKLTVYEAVADLMYYQRKGFAATGIEQEQVIEIMNIISTNTSELLVTQQKSEEKQNRILMNIVTQIEDINTIYENVGGRK